MRGTYCKIRYFRHTVELACGANERELKATLKGDMLTAPEQSKQDRSKFSPMGGECVCVGCIGGGSVNGSVRGSGGESDCIDIKGGIKRRGGVYMGTSQGTV
jgi:hypothetical protein